MRARYAGRSLPPLTRRLVSATPRDFTGWDMVNRLAASNLDFREYVDRVPSVHQTGRLEPGHWK